MVDKVHKVLVTTSGLGSRLGNLTTYTNKSLVRVGAKPAISYIIEQYPENTEFVVTLGHFGEHVRGLLELLYPSRDITYVEVENFSGKGSSLGWSMLCAQDHLQCPFIFHTCDSILQNNPPPPEQNWVGVSDVKDSFQYRTVKVLNNQVVSFQEKGEINYDYAYIGVCGIKDYESFWNSLKNIYDSDPENSSLSDCHALQKMITDGSKFTFAECDWYDIGNINDLRKTREKIGEDICVLDKEEENTYIFEDSVVKFFYDPEKVAQRVHRANLLDPLTPAIMGSCDNFYRYEFAQGKPFSENTKLSTFKQFLNWASLNLWKLDGENIKEVCEKFYFDKTEGRIHQFLESYEESPLPINGLECPPILEQIEKIDKDWMCEGVSSHFHGDFILDNIIYDVDKFKLIDWRHNFGDNALEYGDLYYDLSKLNHSLSFNHALVNQDCYTIDFSDDNITVDILRKNTLVEFQKAFEEFVEENGWDLKKIKILTSLIWINMSPLHEYPLNIFLFYFGKYNLWRNINEQ